MDARHGFGHGSGNSLEKRCGVFERRMRQAIKIHQRNIHVAKYRHPAATYPVVAAAGALTTLGLVLPFHPIGPVSLHMTVHIGLMIVAAPLVALAIDVRGDRRVSRPSWLWAIAALQVALLWIAHAPPVHEAAMHFGGVQAGMYLVLFGVAVAFWLVLLRLPFAARWHAIPVLLLTGKLTCFLAVLIVFAPRVLFAGSHPAGHDLGDQQLAGLLMIIACPLSYVVAAAMIAAQMLLEMDRRSQALKLEQTAVTD